MSFLVDPIWSWPAVALVAFGLVAMVLATYPRRVRHLAPGRRRLLLAFRLTAAIALALAMVRPAVQFEESEKKNSLIYVIGDASRSMNTKDGPGGISRRDALVKLLKDAEPQLAEIAKDVEIRFFDFATELTPVDKPSPNADGAQSALGVMLEGVRRSIQEKRLSAVILLSDGAQRAVPPLDADPRSMARLLGLQQVPVFTVPLGASGIAESSIDLAVEDLLADPLPFEKKVVPVTAKLRVIGAAGRKLEVSLLVEDRTGKQPGESGEMKVPPVTRTTRPRVTLETKKNSDVLPVELSWIPDRPGEFKIAVEVTPVEGELRGANNRVETIIAVQKGGIRVAYIDRVRPEQKFLRLVNNSDKIQLDFQPVRAGRFAAMTELDPDLFKQGKYDAYILGDVPADLFGPERLKALAARVRDGAGLLMIGGYYSFGCGGYADTPIADVLPVAMLAQEKQAGDEIAPDLHFLEPLKMVATPRGLQHYVMRLDASRNRELWDSLAPLEGANKLRRKNDAVEVLAETAEGVPLLLAHEVGPARVAAFAGDTTYQWVLNGQREAHQRFWRQMILWLSHKEADSDQPVWVRTDNRNIAPRQAVPLIFGARKEDGTPLNDVEFTIAMVDPTGKQTAVPARRSGDQHTAEFTEAIGPGDWWVRATASKDGKQYSLPAWTRFLVDSRDLEMDNPAADPGLLREISELTGGMLIPPERLTSILEEKYKNGDFQLREVSQFHRITLWDNWIFLLVFVGLMTLEWGLRKRFGLV